jgi:hypothetical protein
LPFHSWCVACATNSHIPFAMKRMIRRADLPACLPIFLLHFPLSAHTNNFIAILVKAIIIQSTGFVKKKKKISKKGGQRNTMIYPHIQHHDSSCLIISINSGVFSCENGSVARVIQLLFRRWLPRIASSSSFSVLISSSVAASTKTTTTQKAVVVAASHSQTTTLLKSSLEPPETQTLHIPRPPHISTTTHSSRHYTSAATIPSDRLLYASINRQYPTITLTPCVTLVPAPAIVARFDERFLVPVVRKVVGRRD